MSDTQYPRGNGYREQPCCANCMYGVDTSQSELTEYRCFKHVPAEHGAMSWLAPRVETEDICDEWKGDV